MRTSILITLIVLLSGIAFAAPGIPHQFYGTVNFANGPAPDNILVEAKIGGIIISTTTVLNGKYGYNPSIFLVTDPDSNRAGRTIEFYVQGSKASTATFSNGDSTNLHLSVSGSMGKVNVGSNETVKNMTIVITPESPTQLNVGSELSISVSSSSNVTADIERVEKLTTTFFTGSYAVPSGKSMLNAYEIKIVGNVTVTVTMTYDDTGMDESTIMPYKFDGTSWVPLTADKIVSRDTVNNRITFKIIAETPYTLFGSQPSTTTTTTTGGGGAGGGCIANYTLTSPASITVTAGSNATIPVTFTSTGTCSSSTIITATVPTGWSATSATTGSVPSGLSKVVYIIVSLPLDATDGNVIFTATASGVKLSSTTVLNLPTPPVVPVRPTVENLTNNTIQPEQPQQPVQPPVQNPPTGSPITGFATALNENPTTVSGIIVIIVLIIAGLIYRWHKKAGRKGKPRELKASGKINVIVHRNN